MKTIKDFAAKPDVVRWKTYAKGLAVLAGFLILFALYAQFRITRATSRQADSQAQLYDLKHRLDSAAYRAEYFENVYGEVVADNTVLEAQNSQTLKELSTSIFNLKNNQEKLVSRVTYLTKTAQRARIDSVFIRYDTTRIPTYANGRSDSIGVPQQFTLNEKDRYVSGQIRKTGIMIDRLEIPDSLYLRGGVRKKGFLNLGRETFVQAIHTSPYIQTTGLSEITLKPKVKRWGVGPYVGYGWDGTRFAPSGGISLQYSLIRF